MRSSRPQPAANDSFTRKPCPSSTGLPYTPPCAAVPSPLLWDAAEPLPLVLLCGKLGASSWLLSAERGLEPLAALDEDVDSSARMASRHEVRE